MIKSGKNRISERTNKVLRRREVNIREAVERGDYDEVLKLEQQILDNAQRRDREYNLCSLDEPVSESGDVSLLDCTADKKSLNCLTHIIEEENSHEIIQSIKILSDKEQQILLLHLGLSIENERLEISEVRLNFSEIAKMLKLSRQTVSKYFNHAILTLRNMLKDLKD